MIQKLYILQWIALIFGIVFLLVSIYTLTRKIKRDRIIAISVFFICLLVYFFTALRINSVNSKAEVYIGTHELKSYNNSSEFRVEILPDKKYRIFDDKDTIKNGKWKLINSKKTVIIALDGQMFGVGELAIKTEEKVE